MACNRHQSHSSQFADHSGGRSSTSKGVAPRSVSSQCIDLVEEEVQVLEGPARGGLASKASEDMLHTKRDGDSEGEADIDGGDLSDCSSVTHSVASGSVEEIASTDSESARSRGGKAPRLREFTVSHKALFKAILADRKLNYAQLEFKRPEGSAPGALELFAGHGGVARALTAQGFAALAVDHRWEKYTICRSMS